MLGDIETMIKDMISFSTETGTAVNITLLQQNVKFFSLREVPAAAPKI